MTATTATRGRTHVAVRRPWSPLAGAALAVAVLGVASPARGGPPTSVPAPPPSAEEKGAPLPSASRPEGARRGADTVPSALARRAPRTRPYGGDARVPATEVERWTVRLLTEPARRARMEAGLARMGRHERVVRAALRRHALPEGLLSVVLVESEGREDAVSPAGATGLWQLMAGTARGYGLEVSAYVDERRDPVRSTDAAVRHLRDLHRRFGSWHLALAAYNCGAGCVARALGSGAGRGPGDETPYWAARPRLPRETRLYVPLFLATAAVARDPAGLGLRVRREPPLAFAQMWVAGGVPLEAVARAHAVPLATLLRLNPHLVRGMTPPGRRWPVRVPVGTARPHPRTPPR